MDDASPYGAFERTRRLYGNRPFLHIPAHCAGGLVDLTYEQAGLAIEHTIARYRQAGYGRGHHIALWLEHRAEFYIHWLALNAIGATVVPLGTELTPEEITYLLRQGDVHMLIYLPERHAVAEQAVRSIQGLQLCTPATLGFRGGPPRLATRPDRDSPGQAAIVFTSGSTGRPKGCVLSNEYFLTFGRWYGDLGGRCVLRSGAERVITPLPVNHVNALAFSSMGMILTGGCIIQLDRFRPSIWWSTVIESRATIMHYLGVMPAMLLQLPPHPNEYSHALKFGIGGGVRESHHGPFEDRFRVPLIEAWAMTETGGAGTISTHVGPRHVGRSCIGQASPGYSEARILDDQCKELPPECVGELVMRAAGDDPRRGFFSGYYNDPEATESAWQCGWLHSGDLAKRGADGSFFFVGRRKQMIRRSGENISANEVEAVLAADARIKEVAIVPVPDDIREEEVFACIVAESHVVPSIAVVSSILSDAAARLTYYKLPGYMVFVESLPVTATQKTRYGALTELARSLLASHSSLLFDVRHAKRRYIPEH